MEFQTRSRRDARLRPPSRRRHRVALRERSGRHQGVHLLTELATTTERAPGALHRGLFFRSVEPSLTCFAQHYFARRALRSYGPSLDREDRLGASFERHAGSYQGTRASWPRTSPPLLVVVCTFTYTALFRISFLSESPLMVVVGANAAVSGTFPEKLPAFAEPNPVKTRLFVPGCAPA